MVGLIRNIDSRNPEQPFFHMVSRKEWGAHAPTKELPKLELPISNMRFTHTGADRCDTHDQCRKLLKKLQFEHMDTLNHHDIRYNFMIGADGIVYEGRGWETEPDRPNAHNELMMDSYEIAYIGDFEEEAPPASYLRAAGELMTYAVKTKKVHHFFEGIHLQ